jgi:hypothetical protein
MKRAMKWILAASLGAGGLALAGCERNDSNKTTSSGGSNTSSTADQNIRNKDDAAKVAGSKIPGDQIGVADLNLIYKTLGDTAEAALTKGSFDDMVERFVEADRKRIGDFKDMKFDDLDGRIEAFRQAWKAKYNADFDIDDKVLENWATVSKAGESSDKTMANAMIPAGHSLPAITVPLVKDNVAWRIDLPDDVSGAQLKQNVLTHLTKFDQMKAQWPADVLEAKRTAVHHVYAGLFNAK